jgi:hypothetical protein
VNCSLLSAFAQIIVFSHLLADHPFAASITVKSSCHLVIPWFIGRCDVLRRLDQLKQPLGVQVGQTLSRNVTLKEDFSCSNCTVGLSDNNLLVMRDSSSSNIMFLAFTLVTFPSHVTSTSAIEKGKWLEWRDTPERMDSSRSNGPVIPDLDLDEEESFIIGRLVSADVIEHETDHAPDYGDYGVISGRLVMS